MQAAADIVFPLRRSHLAHRLHMSMLTCGVCLYTERVRSYPSVNLYTGAYAIGLDVCCNNNGAQLAMWTITGLVKVPFDPETRC